MTPSQSGARLLNSWKEIANYLGRGVRTVQRWEKVGLPVRRLGNGRRAPVMADARDLDRWLQRAELHGFGIQQSSEQLIGVRLLHDVLEQAQCLRDEMVALRESTRISVARLIATLSSIEKSYLQSRSDVVPTIFDPPTAPAIPPKTRIRHN